MGVVQALRELRAPLNEEPAPKWNPQTCRIVFEYLETAGHVARCRGDKKAEDWCMAWAHWWADRAEGKSSGDETFPPGPGEAT